MKNSRTLSTQETHWQQNLKRIWLEKKTTLKLTQESASAAAGWKTQSAFNQFLNGKLALNTDAIVRLARVLQVKPADINPDLAESFAPSWCEIVETVNKVPLISWEMAGEICQSRRPLDKNDVEAWMLCPSEHSNEAYYLRVVGDAMAHEYMEGDLILVEPTAEPLHGDDVVIMLPTEAVVLKRLHITPDGKHLESINQAWPNRITHWADGSVICGVVMGMIRPRARRR